MKNFTYTALCTAAILLATVASAEEINQSINNQQNLIYTNVTDGSLSSQQFNHLNYGEAKLENTLMKDHKHSNLSPQEQQELNRETNESDWIYRDVVQH